MKVTGAALYRYRLPLTSPITLRGEPHGHRDGLLLRLYGEHGAEGIGEIAPLPGFSEESLDEAEAEARQCVQLCVNQPLHELCELARQEGEGVLSPMPSVQFGLACALDTLDANASKRSPGRLFAEGEGRRSVSLNALLWGGREHVLRRAAEVKEQGYLAAKLKAGRADVHEDAALVKEVARALGPRVALRLDANQGWTRAQALRFAEAVKDVPLQYIEEPLDDPAELAGFVYDTQAPIALDESLSSDLIYALESGFFEELETMRTAAAPTLGHAGNLSAASAFVIKPSITGITAHSLKRMAARHKDKLFVLSSAFESRVGLILIAAMAAYALPRDIPVGLDTEGWLAEGLIEQALPVAAGKLDVAAALPLLAQVQWDRCEEVWRA